MLPIQHRLTKREDFGLVYKNGFYAASDGLSLKFLKTNKPFTRVGFPVGKNYSKKATVRNRTRRILREAIRLQLTSLKTGYDIVIMISPQKKNSPFNETTMVLKKLFLKASLFI